MNVGATAPTSATLATPSAADASTPAKKAPPTRAAPVAVAVRASPAATVTLTAVPASVKPEDRALYLQILKSVGGNAAAALAALQASEAAKG
jgi:hypothetical protein